mgnify:CR=1 FL=1
MTAAIDIHAKKRVLIVAANPGNRAVRLELKVPLSLTGWESNKITVTDLWSGTARRTLPVTGESKQAVIPIEIAADQTPGGGLAVFLLQP